MRRKKVKRARKRKRIAGVKRGVESGRKRPGARRASRFAGLTFYEPEEVPVPVTEEQLDDAVSGSFSGPGEVEIWPLPCRLCGATEHRRHRWDCAFWDVTGHVPF